MLDFNVTCVMMGCALPRGQNNVRFRLRAASGGVDVELFNTMNVSGMRVIPDNTVGFPSECFHQ